MPADAGAAPADLPKTIGRYRILARLAGSSSNDVYRGFDPMIERPVVVKVFRLESGDPAADLSIKQAFYQEMQRTGLLMHHGIAALFDAGEQPGMLFMATEYVDGESLAERFATGIPWDLPGRASIAAQMLDALDFACQLGVPHLNLKPTNVVIGPGHAVKVGGFGVGSFVGRLAASTGTPVPSVSRYAAPERVNGQPGDQRSDVFSSALIARDLLLGSTDTAAALPAYLSDHGVNAGDLQAVFARATDPDPGRRFATPEALKMELLLTLGLGDTHVWYEPQSGGGASGEAPPESETILTPSGVYVLANDPVGRADKSTAPPVFPDDGDAPTMMQPAPAKPPKP